MLVEPKTRKYRIQQKIYPSDREVSHSSEDLGTREVTDSDLIVHLETTPPMPQNMLGTTMDMIMAILTIMMITLATTMATTVVTMVTTMGMVTAIEDDLTAAWEIIGRSTKMFW